MLTIEQLNRKLLARVKEDECDFEKKSIHLLGRPLKPGEELVIGPNRYQVARESFLVVVDAAPGAYWTHPVAYELHEIHTGEIVVICEKFPLEDVEMNNELVEVHIPDLPHLKKKILDTQDIVATHRLQLEKLEAGILSTSFKTYGPCVNHKHALFVTGMDNMVDFRNDFVNMRNILIDRYGYDPANIIIVMGDGSGYPDLPVDYPGTVADLDTALDEYAPGGSRELTAADSLFIYTFNHGGVDAGNSYLCMHPSWDRYYDYQLQAKLDNINCSDVMVAMNQCHSGGFVGDVLATTGPTNVTIMTACSETQSAYPASTGSHGYFSVVMCAALNWAFPTGISPAFPGYVAGTITAHDTNSDGMISAEEAWNYVNSMMNANHWATMSGIETPQWGESSAGIGASLFWGYPEIEVRDGIPLWESPDIYLHDPTVIPDDTTAPGTGHPANWGDLYHPDTSNRIVARVFNRGCAPCRNTTVEFRVMSFGVGGGTTLIGTGTITEIAPGSHDYAWTDWNFPSTLVHRCVFARADTAGDPAMPFSGGTNIGADDNQAQRNLDPAYSAPVYEDQGQTAKEIERKFTIGNEFDREAKFEAKLDDNIIASELITTTSDDLDTPFALKPGETREIKVRFTIKPGAEIGEKLHVPIKVNREDSDGTMVMVGGVTFNVEVAQGRLQGGIITPERIAINNGKVTIENIKQQNLIYATKADVKGTFSFDNIDPGQYRITVCSDEGCCEKTITIQPNTVTKTAMPLVLFPKQVGGILKDKDDQPVINTQILVRDKEAKRTYMVWTDSEGAYKIPCLKPGTYHIVTKGEDEVVLNFLANDCD